MSTPAKDAMIDQYREEEYEQYLDWLDQQQEQQARLVEQGHVPSPIGGYHAEV